MKLFSLLSIILILVVACNSNESEQDQKITISTENIESKESTSNQIAKPIEKPGEFIELYPNGKLKTEGWFNTDTKRENIWYSYYESGIKWSEQNFSNGLKEGHSIVYYPNGKIHYSGGYLNDKKTGHWIFYNELGEITKEEDY